MRRWGSGRGRHRLAACLAFLLALGGCTPPPDWADAAGSDSAAAAAPLSVVDDAGRTVTLPDPAQRIVSLMPAATETLIALGATELLVARTDFDRGAEVRHLPSVGGGLTPSLEVLASLQPDLVVAWEEAGAARVRPRLEEFGIAVLALRTQDTTAIFDNIQRLGTLTGRTAAADSVARAVREGLDSVRASVAGLPRPSVLYVVGVDPPLTAGPRSFIAQLIEVAGGRTVFPDLAGYWPQVSLEEVVRRRPDVLLLPVGAAEQASLDRLRSAAGWRELLANDRTRVRTLPADIVNRPAPNIVETARLLRDAIHPTGEASP
jgi:iron complex transport system substrate-binding protein